jgi:glycosyltransferase involved in cell wall biosynthesis
MIKNKITFVIPSIGRNTLKRSIDSLNKQTNDSWNAIIVYDGVEPEIDFSSDKIKTIKIPKTGVMGNHHGQSGLVRNYGLDICDTEWVGFLDDDDTIDSNYVETLLTKYNDLDLVIWRMRYVNNMVIPRIGNDNIVFGNIGISISFKKKFLDGGLRFKNNRDGEDFDIVKSMVEISDKYLITNEVYYKVGF